MYDDRSSANALLTVMYIFHNLAVIFRQITPISSAVLCVEIHLDRQMWNCRNIGMNIAWIISISK